MNYPSQAPGPYPQRGYGASSTFGPQWGQAPAPQPRPGFAQTPGPRQQPQQAQQPYRPQYPPPQRQPQYQPQQPQQQWGGQGPQQHPGQPGPQGYQSWQQPRPPKRKSGSALWLALPVVVVALMVGYYALSRGNSPQETVAYVNEEYVVPAAGTGPKQVVDTFDDPDVLTKNKLYEEPIAVPVRCEPASVEDIRDEDQLQARMTDLAECLTRSFGPAIEAAGYEPYQPRVLVYSTVNNTPCGELEMPGAFYCGANQGIYMSTDISRIAGKDLARLDYVMAHEYAHNVQGRTGILVQRIYAQRAASSKSMGLEINRRLETQADCLAATFVASAGDSLGYGDEDRQQIVDAARRVGDDRFMPPEELPGGHGVSDSRQLWVERGFDASLFQECNTFVAPADEVR